MHGLLARSLALTAFAALLIAPAIAADQSFDRGTRGDRKSVV